MRGIPFPSPARTHVIPAKAGIQDSGSLGGKGLQDRWTPAFAGVTGVVRD